MTKFLRMTALAASAVAALSAAPAMASPTSDQDDGYATVKIYAPLTIKAAVGNATVDYGILVSPVATRQAGDFTVEAAATPSTTGYCQTGWTCSGALKSAKFDLSGSADASVSIDLPATVTLTNASSDTVDMDTSISLTDSNLDSLFDAQLDSTGVSSFYVGGTLHVLAGTKDGVYNGSFTVTADYQ